MKHLPRFCRASAADSHRNINQWNPLINLGIHLPLDETRNGEWQLQLLFVKSAYVWYRGCLLEPNSAWPVVVTPWTYRSSSESSTREARRTSWKIKAQTQLHYTWSGSDLVRPPRSQTKVGVRQKMPPDPYSCMFQSVSALVWCVQSHDVCTLCTLTIKAVFYLLRENNGENFSPRRQAFFYKNPMCFCLYKHQQCFEHYRPLTLVLQATRWQLEVIHFASFCSQLTAHGMITAAQKL